MEYVQALRKRYFRAAKEEKGKMLNEFTQVTGLHRKAAIRLLNRPDAPRRNKRHGRPAMYKDVLQPLIAIWEASDSGDMPRMWHQDVSNWKGLELILWEFRLLMRPDIYRQMSGLFVSIAQFIGMFNV